MSSSDHSERRQSPESHANPLSSDILRFIRLAIVGLMCLSGGCATINNKGQNGYPKIDVPAEESTKNTDETVRNDDDDLPCNIKSPDDDGACPWA